MGRELWGAAMIPSAFAELADALGIGGIPQGKITEIFGPHAQHVEGMFGFGTYTSLGGYDRERLDAVIRTVEKARRDSIVVVSNLAPPGSDISAHALSHALRKLAAYTVRDNVTLVVVNDKTPTSNALKFYASVRIQTTANGKVKIVKNCFGADELQVLP